jgi:hypothetical protein
MLTGRIWEGLHELPVKRGKDDERANMAGSKRSEIQCG